MGLTVSLALLNLSIVTRASAGGSGLNVVVVINQSSSNSCTVGNYYCERRQVPPNNVLMIQWPGSNISWTSNDFQANLLNPLVQMLATRQLTNQAQYVVLSMDIPFQTTFGSSVDGTTSALFYGLKDASGPTWLAMTNSYASSEAAFEDNKPQSAPGPSFLTTMLTGTSVAQAEQMIDQGVASDGTFPPQPVLLAKSSDVIRNIRYHEFDNALFNTRVIGNYSLQRTNSDTVTGLTNLFGYQTGLAGFNINPGTFVPGAIADSMTSFGGIIFGPNGQTTLLAFIGAGASGSYGTVTEPTADPAKFPSPLDYFYQARGFSIAESYYQSLDVPYEGLIVAEPLAAPCQRLGAGSWLGLASNAVLRGTSPLSLQFTAADTLHPLYRVDLFVDGKYYQTVTNLAPQPGNRININANGYALTYSVPSNATPSSVASDIAGLFNGPGVANLTQIQAASYGDRVELQSTALPGAAPFCFFDNDTTPRARFYRTALLPQTPAGATVTALGRLTNGAFKLHVNAPASSPYTIQASSDLLNWTPLYSNPAGGALDYSDMDAPNFRQRFYRAIKPVPSASRPVLGLASLGPGLGRMVRVSGAGAPSVIQISSNLVQWTPAYTNLAPGMAQISINSVAGSGSALTTTAQASRPTFTDSLAYGMRTLSFNGILQVGTWLQLAITKTNGVSITFGVTNASVSSTLLALAQQLTNAINASPLLAGSDGVVAEDLGTAAFGAVSFSLRARSPGYPAALVTIQFSASTSLTLNTGTVARLDGNISDLQARNHIYIRTGVANLPVTFPLDTTLLADGFHDLTAVAYEGGNVRTQTRISIPIQVLNTNLTATMTLLDLPVSASVQGTYHIQVAANTSSIKSIQLFTTGGVLNTVSNAQTATFVVNGPPLGIGLHPFFAVVQKTTGQTYRTASQWVRFY